MTDDERADLENGGWLRFFESGDVIADDLVREATARGDKLVEAGEPIPAAVAEAIYTAVVVATAHTLATKICSAGCKETARWIRDARANAERTAARGFPVAVEQVEASIAKKLAQGPRACRGRGSRSVPAVRSGPSPVWSRRRT